MAPDITVGDEHPSCDTYTPGPPHAVNDHPLVGRCHVTRCTFNDEHSCMANGITVSGHDQHADCYTFRTD